MSALPRSWRMRDGRIIAIRDMDDHHLTCTILMVGRAATGVADYIFRRDLALLARAHCVLNGEAALDAVDAEMASIRPHTVAEILSTWPVWHALRLEADRRAAEVGLVPVPEEAVRNVPEKTDVPKWAVREPAPPVLVPIRPRVVPTQSTLKT